MVLGGKHSRMCLPRLPISQVLGCL